MADGQQMTGRMWAQVALSAAVLVVSVVLSLLAVRFLKSKPVTATEPDRVPVVKVAAVVAHQGELTIEADGVVVPYREITLSAEVTGRVVQQEDACRAGRYVRAGAPLLVIDPSDYQIALEQLEQEQRQAAVALEELDEQLQGLSAQIEVTEAELALRQRELKRQQNLAGVISSTDLERAEANELMARNNLLSLRNQLGVAKISRGRLESIRELTGKKLAKAELDLTRTVIQAPVDGVVVRELVERDTFVQRGTPLVTVEDTSKVEVECKLEMEDLFWLWDRPELSAGPDAASAAGAEQRAYSIPEADVDVAYRLAGQAELEYVWAGRLARFDGIGLDAQTRTVPCRVVVDNPLQRRSRLPTGPPALVRGMYVTVRIHARPATVLLRIPERALRAEYSSSVWRVRGGKLEVVPVRFAGLETGDPGTGPAVETPPRWALVYVEDPSRLRPGDEVVVSPLSLVRSGMEVQTSGPVAAGTDRN